MNVLGLDIGGANIKAAATDGRTWASPFALWRHPERLADELAGIFAQFPAVDAVAVTMTGELADCFATKAEGVARILDAVAVNARPRGLPLSIWTTAGRFVSLADALASPLDAAAANWHALATWTAARAPEGCALLLDVGTTTTDIIPLAHGRPVAQGRTDLGRLQAGELVYTGARRTPLCAVAREVRFRGHLVPVAAELFATTLDVGLLRGDIAEDAADCDTADGRPATVPAAYERVARMLCCDRTELTMDEARGLADQWAAAQLRQIQSAVRTVCARLPQPCRTAILSGSGEFLARRFLDATPELTGVERRSLSDAMSPQLAEAACAYAVARLLADA